MTGGAHSGTRHARLRRSSGFLRRTCNLLGARDVHLTFWSRSEQFERMDHVLVNLSVDGRPTITLETITIAESDNLYHFHDIDLSAIAMTSNVRIEFDSNMNKGFFRLDDVEITGFSEAVLPKK